jgi:KUP system potassium uptake protein
MQIQNTKVTAASLLVALGIIYGDIGTSPLYALRAVIGNRPIEATLVNGGVSCIFWTLVFQTTVKSGLRYGQTTMEKAGSFPYMHW